MLWKQRLALVHCLGSVADLLDIRAVIQFTSITSAEQRAHMQVSSNDRSERTIVFTVPIFAEGQINEERLLRNVESWEGWKSWGFPDTSNLVLTRLLVLLCYGFQESNCYQLPEIMLPFPIPRENEKSVEHLLSCCTRKCYVEPTKGGLCGKTSHESTTPSIQRLLRWRTRSPYINWGLNFHHG